MSSRRPEALGLIYALLDPETEDVMYVGATTTALRRRYGRLLAAAKNPSRSRTPVLRWLETLILAGERPVLYHLESCSLTQLQDAERRWIAWWRARGYAALNVRAGGDGWHTSKVT